VVVAKLDPSTGVPTWAIELIEGAFALAVDPTDSDLYVTGNFYDVTVEIGNFTLANSDANGNGDVFLAKLDKTTGAALSAVRYGGTSDELVTAICVDSTGATTLVGNFYGTPGTSTLTFGGTTLALQGSSDTFVARVVGVSGSLRRIRETAEWCFCTRLPATDLVSPFY
jgi:hypothetical protein